MCGTARTISGASEQGIKIRFRTKRIRRFDVRIDEVTDFTLLTVLADNISAGGNVALMRPPYQFLLYPG